MSADDAFGRHELLDRTGLLVDLIDDWLLEHEGIQGDERVMASEAQHQLYRLYQLIGSRHIKTDDT